MLYKYSIFSLQTNSSTKQFKLVTPRPLQIQPQQPLQYLLIPQLTRPTIRRKHRRVQLLVRQVKPGGAGVVQVGLGCASCARPRSGPRRSASARGISTSSLAAWAMACTRGSSCGSLPGGQGKGKVSKVVMEYSEGRSLPHGVEFPYFDAHSS